MRGLLRTVPRTVLCVGLVVTVAVVSSCESDPGYRGRSSRTWIAQLASADRDNRADAATALGEVLRIQPDAPSVVRALVGALADTSDVVRTAAAHAIRNAARGGGRVREQLVRDAVPAVTVLLADSAHATVRAQAVAVLAGFGPAAAPATVPVIASALGDPAPGVRRQAVQGLGALDTAARTAAPHLTARLGDRDPVVREAAALALGRVGGPAPVVIPALVGALGDSIALVRAAAAGALGTLGAAAPDSNAAGRSRDDVMERALDALRRASRDPSVGVRVAAVTALGLIGDAASRPALTRALADPSPDVRREAEHALSALHRRGEGEPPRPEPSRRERCIAEPRRPGC